MERPVTLTRIAGTCEDGEVCPTVYLTDRRTIAVQGYLLPGKDVSAGEAIVEIPLPLLLEAARVSG
ncbi:hypothetical protein ACFWY9_33230 [Amycolatopsis sp. NPDC059027]|uniref:hypothetical protein n=1 Tax=unclassified Amycolatopsis TaxID=2618356 RepID=UPI003672A75C